MKYRYTKYTGDLLDEIDLEDLVSKLSDMLLSSGFSNPWGDPSSGDEDRSMQALHDAILEALFSGGVLSDESPIGAVLNGLFGYRSAPTPLEVAAYFLYLIPVLVLFLVDGRVTFRRRAAAGV